MDAMDKGYSPEFESFPNLLLMLSRQPTVESIVKELVNQVVENRPHIAAAAVWLAESAGTGDPCERMEIGPAPQLRLVASAVKGEAGPEEWTHAGGEYTFVPFDEPLVGRVAADGVAVVHPDDRDWEPPEWARDAGIVGLNSQPVVHLGKVLGVFSVFFGLPVRESIEMGGKWHQVLCTQLAAAIVNARSFEEIECLRQQLELENEYLRGEFEVEGAFGDIVGESQALRRVLTQVTLVAPTDTSVLILGESGTGKELIAREIHERSPRSRHPLIRVNCAAIPRELFESEFFGHVRGAFTGAVRDRTGRFELADNGSLFLDEVGEIPLELQGKLLRVLQEGTFERIGEERTRLVDVRIIAASNRDLKEQVEAGRFRQDLYFRLSVFPVEIPPLRHRVEDIPLLAKYFIRTLNTRPGIRPAPLKRRDLLALQSYDWPGNVRELQNVIERAVIIARGGDLSFDFLPGSKVPRGLDARGRDTNAAAGAPLAGEGPASAEDPVLTDGEWRELERKNLRRALDQTDWRIQGEGGAAALLGVKPTTLRSRIKALRIEKED